MTLATVSVGLPALTAPASAAISTERLNIVPVNAANNSVDNDCQYYRVTASNLLFDSYDWAYDGDNTYGSTHANVILTPGAGMDSQFCDPLDVNSTGTAVGSGDQGTHLPDQHRFTFNDTNDYNQSTFTFGVQQNPGLTPPADFPTGTIGVEVYVDQSGNNLPSSGEPDATATDNIVEGNPTAPADAN